MTGKNHSQSNGETEITLDDLAAMISRMDERIEARFAKIEERFDTLETEVHKGFAKVSEDMKELKDIHMEEMNRRIYRLEEAVFHR